MLVRYELCARMTRLTTQNSSLEPRGDEEEPEDQGAETAEAGGLAEAGATCPAYIGGVVTIRVSCLENKKSVVSLPHCPDMCGQNCIAKKKRNKLKCQLFEGDKTSFGSEISIEKGLCPNFKLSLGLRADRNLDS